MFHLVPTPDSKNDSKNRQKRHRDEGLLAQLRDLAEIKIFSVWDDLEGTWIYTCI